MKRTLTILLGLSMGALAQEPPAPGDIPAPPEVPAPVPTVQPAPAPGTAPGIAPVAPRPSGPPDPNAIKYPEGDGITEPNLTGLFAAQLYEDVTGKRVIMSSAISQAEVFFVQRGPLTNKQVADLLTKSLLGDGLAFIPDPLDPDIVRLAASGPINGTTTIPKEYVNDEFDLPTNDQLVTYKMTFKFLKPEDALKIFQTVLGQLSASGNITAVPNASSLMITENSNLIRQMIKIQKDIDVATSIAERWVEVTYGDVDEIAERMNEIYNEQASNQTTRTARANTPPAPGSVPGATASAGEEVPIKIIGVRRTSRILLVGRPADLVAAEAMVRSFDIPSSGKNRQTFRLRYLRVGDFLPIAQDAISVTLGESDTGGAGGQGAQNSNRNSLASQNTNTNAQNSNRNTGQAGAGGQAGGGNRATIQEQDIPTAPESALIGNTLLVGDNVANTIIVNGPPHHIELIRDLIADLDTESQQVALSAVVGSYAINNGLNFGVDLARVLRDSQSSFRAGGSSSFGDGAPSVITTDALADVGQLLTAQGLSGNGVSLYGLINDDFGVFVNALESTNKFKTLERTVLTTRNNRVAQLSSGQRIAIPSGTFSSGINGGQNTNVEYRDVTLELLIQPLINSDNKVTLEISLVRDSVGNPRTINADLIVPDINTQQLSTSITVEDGSAIILGGIISETETKTKTGVPILSRIPGIGRLFGSTDNSGNQSELVIMIQPRIIKSRAEMDGFRGDYERSTAHTGAVVDAFPERTDLLPENGTMPTYSDAEPKGGIANSGTPSSPASSSAASNESVVERQKSSKLHGRSGRPGAR